MTCDSHITCSAGGDRRAPPSSSASSCPAVPGATALPQLGSEMYRHIHRCVAPAQAKIETGSPLPSTQQLNQTKNRYYWLQLRLPCGRVQAVCARQLGCAALVAAPPPLLRPPAGRENCVLQRMLPCHGGRVQNHVLAMKGLLVLKILPVDPARHTARPLCSLSAFVFAPPHCPFPAIFRFLPPHHTRTLSQPSDQPLLAASSRCMLQFVRFPAKRGQVALPNTVLLCCIPATAAEAAAAAKQS
jgi:hypothetical protein